MIDQTQINLIDLVPNLKKVNESEYAGPCPMCGGEDRFIVWPNEARWWCRRGCGSGDPIALLMARDSLSFKKACSQLSLTLENNYPKRSQPVTRPQIPVSEPKAFYGADDPHWQAIAGRFVVSSMYSLWTGIGQSARNYLSERGISDTDILKNHYIGLNTSVYKSKWGYNKIYLPVGVVIPWIIGGKLYRIQVRRSPAYIAAQRQALIDSGTPEEQIDLRSYGQANGSRSHGLYNVDQVAPGRRVVMVETALDALLLAHLGDTLGFTPVAVGSASEGRTERNIAILAQADHVYLAFDNDSAGMYAGFWWREALGEDQATRLQPTEKDPGDMFTVGGHEILRDWLMSAFQRQAKK
jgi:DNA primase